MKRLFSLYISFVFIEPYVLSSTSITASVKGLCLTPAVGTTLTLIPQDDDRIAIVFGTTLATSILTPSTDTLFAIKSTTPGSVCRYSVAYGGGSSIAINPNFSGMTFTNPSLAIRNTSVDNTGVGKPGTAPNTTMVTLGALSGDSISLTSGKAIEVQRRARGITTFAFGSSAPIMLTSYPKDETSFALTGNDLFTITVTVIAIPG